MGVFSFHSFVKTGRFLHFHCSRVKKHLSRGYVKIFHLCRGAQKEILFLVIMHKYGLYVYSLFIHSNAIYLKKRVDGQLFAKGLWYPVAEVFEGVFSPYTVMHGFSEISRIFKKN